MLDSYWKGYHFWRQDLVYYALCCIILSVNKIYKPIALELHHQNPTGESVRNFCERVCFRRWFRRKRCSSHSKWPAVCIFVFLQILLSRRLIRATTQMSGFSLIWITLLNVLRILNYDGLWENKKFPDENQRFDWIKSIHGYRLVSIGWLADIDLFYSMIWLV